jgi:ABC-type multidrug transport system ATPase subunit
MKFELTEVEFSYPGTTGNALQKINLSFDSGSITGLVGANGSGKSTLIKILLRQLIGYKGTYKIDSQLVDDFSGSILGTYGIGYSPEDVVLDEFLTGYEILYIIKEIRAISDTTFNEDLEFLSTSLRVEDWLQKKPCSEYSQGMRRKLSIMIALIGPIRYAILDEPNNGLDPLSIYGLKQAIVKRKSEGIGVLISTHVLDIIDKISDDVVMLRKGSLLYNGTVPDLKNKWPKTSSLEEIYCEMYSSEEVAGIQ